MGLCTVHYMINIIIILFIKFNYRFKILGNKIHWNMLRTYFHMEEKRSLRLSPKITAKRI